MPERVKDPHIHPSASPKPLPHEAEGRSGGEPRDDSLLVGLGGVIKDASLIRPLRLRLWSGGARLGHVIMVRAARAPPPFLPSPPLLRRTRTKKNTTTKKSTIDTHDKGPVEGREPPDSRVRHKPVPTVRRVRVAHI